MINYTHTQYKEFEMNPSISRKHHRSEVIVENRSQVDEAPAQMRSPGDIP